MVRFSAKLFCFVNFTRKKFGSQNCNRFQLSSRDLNANSVKSKKFVILDTVVRVIALWFMYQLQFCIGVESRFSLNFIRLSTWWSIHLNTNRFKSLLKKMVGVSTSQNRISKLFDYLAIIPLNTPVQKGSIFV